MRRLMACALVGIGVAGCGGGGDAGADPASGLPAGPVYLEFVVNPEGDQREQMEALAGRLLRTGDPGRRIVEMLESLDDDGGGADFERDVKPWLGRRAGMTLSDFSAEEPSFTIALATDDADAAGDFVADLSKRDGARKRTYRDVDYWLDDDDTAVAVHGDFVLLTDGEKAMRRAIALEGEKSMAEARRFREAVGRLPEEREGTIYFDLKSLFDEAAELGAAERQIFSLFLGGAPPTAIAVLAEEDQLALESRGPADQPRSLATLFTGLGYLGATPLVGELPGDSLVGAGAPDFGKTSKQLVAAFAGPLGGAVVAGQLEEDLGIDLDRDVYGWIGDIALFVQGDSLPAAGGGVLIEVTDRAAARKAIPRLVGALQLSGGLRGQPIELEGAELAFELTGGIPLPVVVALAGDRAVIASGRDFASEALSPRARLRESDAWDRAGGVLDGVDPALVVDLPAALAAAERELAADPDLAEAKPYLERLSVLAAGSGEDGDQRRSRVAVGVK